MFFRSVHWCCLIVAIIIMHEVSGQRPVSWEALKEALREIEHVSPFLPPVESHQLAVTFVNTNLFSAYFIKSGHQLTVTFVNTNLSFPACLIKRNHFFSGRDGKSAFIWKFGR